MSFKENDNDGGGMKDGCNIYLMRDVGRTLARTLSSTLRSVGTLKSSSVMGCVLLISLNTTLRQCEKV